MSYDIRLRDPVTGDTLKTDAAHLVRAAANLVGGTSELWLNVTYSYAPHFYRVVDAERGIRFIYGKTGAESIPILRSAAGLLGDDVDEDYWKPTEGNAKRALLGLLALAQLRPDGVWGGD